MRVAVILLFAILLTGGAIWGALHSFNYFSDIERSFAGRCTPVRGVAGPQDIVIDPVRRLAFISSFDHADAHTRGGVHVFDLSDPLSSGWTDMTDGAPAAFRPSGLDYYEDGDVRRLFVVNEAAPAVDIFDVAEDGKLTFLESFSESRLLTSPRHVAAVGPRSFYVVNDVKPGRGALFSGLQFLARRGTGEILYANGTSWRLAAEGLRFAGGVDVSPDGRRLYVAEAAGRDVKVFDRDQGSGVLTPVENIRLPASPESVTVDGDGVLWVAALPKPLGVLRHSGQAPVSAPSEVFRIGADGAATSVYRDDGAEISASTAAARLGDTLLISGLNDKKFLICDLPAGAF